MKPSFWVRSLPPICGIVLFLFFPNAVKIGVRAGMQLCAEVLIPALFPLSVLAGCLVRLDAGKSAERFAGRWMRAMFGLPGVGAIPLFFGLLGGFPLGAQLLAAVYREGRLSKPDAERLSALCNNAGPGFLLGAVGAALGSARLGFALAGIQLLSVLIVGLLQRKPAAAESPHAFPVLQPVPLSAALTRAIADSASAMLRLCGTVSFFGALNACLEAVLSLSALPILWRSGVSGALELSGGISLLRGADPEAGFLLSAALVGWGGVCVHLQAAEAFSEVGLSMNRYFLGKLLQAGVCVLLALLFRSLLQPSDAASALLAALGLLLLTFFTIYKKIHWKSTASVL